MSEKLENILHPLIHERITQISEESSSRYLIIVLPLFLKTKQIYEHERIIFIDAPKEIRRIRLMKREFVSLIYRMYLIGLAAPLFL